MADALRARQQRIVELHRDRDGDSARPARTTRSSCAPRSAGAAPRCGARPRSARKAACMVGSVCRYSASAMALSSASLVPEPTEKCAVAAASPISTMLLVRPGLAQHAVEVEPGRAAQVAGIGHQPMAAEVPGEDLLAGGDRLVLAHAVEAEARARSPREHSTMKVAVSGIELVGVRPDPAVLGLLEDEGEGVVELLVRAEPDVLAGAHVDVGLEHVARGRRAPWSWRRRRRRSGRSRDRARGSSISVSKRSSTPSALRAVLQDVEQPLAADAAEAVARGARDGAAVDARRCRPSRRRRGGSPRR